MRKQKPDIQTRLIHAGEPEPRIEGAVSLPVFQSSTFQYAGQTDYHDLKYIRLNNTPNHKALCEKLAGVENAEDALVTASGMAAISTVFFALLEKGDHVLVQDCLYGGTHDFLTGDLPALGITFDVVGNTGPADWATALKPQTRMFYVESMTNPLLSVIDLPSVAAFAKENNLISVVDNTFPSPVNFRPAEHGFDLSIHSATKYLNGHSDIVAGAVIGRKELVRRVLRKLNHLGATLDPHACFLLHRGMKTLSLRMAYTNESALEIARYLHDHPAVSRVNYPGLPTHPDHRRARDLFSGFSGMMSFELAGGVEAAEAFIEAVRYPILAPSLGGVETLITRPATTSHSGMSPADREKSGITDGLIRLSVGVEATADLIDDFAGALDRISA